MNRGYDDRVFDYLSKHDPSGYAEDYTVINGEVRYIPTCSLGELYPECFDEFGNQIADYE